MIVSFNWFIWILESLSCSVNSEILFFLTSSMSFSKTTSASNLLISCWFATFFEFKELISEIIFKFSWDKFSFFFLMIFNSLCVFWASLTKSECSNENSLSRFFKELFSFSKSLFKTDNSSANFSRFSALKFSKFCSILSWFWFLLSSSIKSPFSRTSFWTVFKASPSFLIIRSFDACSSVFLSISFSRFLMVSFSFKVSSTNDLFFWSLSRFWSLISFFISQSDCDFAWRRSFSNICSASFPDVFVYFCVIFCSSFIKIVFFFVISSSSFESFWIGFCSEFIIAFLFRSSSMESLIFFKSSSFSLLNFWTKDSMFDFSFSNSWIFSLRYSSFLIIFLLFVISFDSWVSKSEFLWFDFCNSVFKKSTTGDKTLISCDCLFEFSSSVSSSIFCSICTSLNFIKPSNNSFLISFSNSFCFWLSFFLMFLSSFFKLTMHEFWFSIFLVCESKTDFWISNIGLSWSSSSFDCLFCSRIFDNNSSFWVLSSSTVLSRFFSSFFSEVKSSIILSLNIWLLLKFPFLFFKSVISSFFEATNSVSLAFSFLKAIICFDFSLIVCKRFSISFSKASRLKFKTSISWYSFVFSLLKTRNSTAISFLSFIFLKTRFSSSSLFFNLVTFWTSFLSISVSLFALFWLILKRFNSAAISWFFCCNNLIAISLSENFIVLLSNSFIFSLSFSFKWLFSFFKLEMSESEYEASFVGSNSTSSKGSSAETFRSTFLSFILSLLFCKMSSFFKFSTSRSFSKAAESFSSANFSITCFNW